MPRKTQNKIYSATHLILQVLELQHAAILELSRQDDVDPKISELNDEVRSRLEVLFEKVAR